MLHSRHAFQQDRVALQVREVKGRRLIEPLLVLQASDSQPGVVITAEEAELAGDPSRGTLRLRLRKGTLEMPDKVRVQFPDEYEQENSPFHENGGPWQEIPLPACFSARFRGNLLSLAPNWQLASESLPGCRPAWPTRKIYLRTSRRSSGNNSGIGKTTCTVCKPNLFRRWVAGFSCLGFALVGTGMAIRLQQRESIDGIFSVFRPDSDCLLPVVGLDGRRCQNRPNPALGCMDRQPAFGSLGRMAAVVGVQAIKAIGGGCFPRTPAEPRADLPLRCAHSVNTPIRFRPLSGVKGNRRKTRRCAPQSSGCSFLRSGSASPR